MNERFPGTVRARVCVCVCARARACASLSERVTVCLSVKERSGSCTGHAVGEEGMGGGRGKEGETT